MLVNATLLKQQISILITVGQYVFPSGLVQPAIAVLPDPELGLNYPPRGTKVTGIEVIISIPYANKGAALFGGATTILNWSILLKNWDNSKNLINETQTLYQFLSANYFVTALVPSPPNLQLGIIEQVRFSLTEYSTQTN